MIISAWSRLESTRHLLLHDNTHINAVVEVGTFIAEILVFYFNKIKYIIKFVRITVQ